MRLFRARSPRRLALLDQRAVNDALAADPSRGRVLETVPRVTFTPRSTVSRHGESGDARLGDQVTAPTMHLREYADVVCAPRSLVVQRDVVLPDTFRNSSRPLLAPAGLRSAEAGFAEPEPTLDLDSARVLPGTFFHLDDYCRGHFGHALTDQLSRMWAWERAKAADPSLRVILGWRKKFPTVSVWEQQLWGAFGISPEDIELVDGPVRVERLLSAQQMMAMPRYVHPAVTDTWDRCGESLRGLARDADHPSRIFVSRRGGSRRCENRPEVEELFRSRGFEIVFPEDRTLPEQAQLFHRAEVVGGFAGSALFNLVFTDRPKHLIVIGTTSYRANNELLIAAVRGHRVDVITCRSSVDPTPGRGRAAKASSFTCDMRQEGARLREILDAL